METTTTTTTSPTAHPVVDPTSVETAATIADAERPSDEDLDLWEKIELKADELGDSLESLLHEGTARRITVKKDGEVIADFPLAIGVVGTVLAAPLAAVAAIVALIADCTIEVVRERPADETTVAPEMTEPAGDAAPVEMPVAAAAATV
jgi:Domain of unknown function (DUF4342)